MFNFRNDAITFGMSEEFGPFSDKQRAGLDFLVTSLESDPNITDIRHAAYMLATTYHETAGTLQPIEEYGKGKGLKYGKIDPVTGQTYYGRGYVQLTWADNYKTMGAALGIDLYNHPELALNPDTAYKIMSRGMRLGSFTGARLIRYIHDDVCDYVNARRIINGTDCAEKIAGYAQKIEDILKGSV